jgi:primosomal protein N'
MGVTPPPMPPVPSLRKFVCAHCGVDRPHTDARAGCEKCGSTEVALVQAGTHQLQNTVVIK